VAIPVEASQPHALTKTLRVGLMDRPPAQGDGEAAGATQLKPPLPAPSKGGPPQPATAVDAHAGT